MSPTRPFTDWHAAPQLLARFANDPVELDDVTAASIEAHLVACVECRLEIAVAADPAFVTISWDGVADRIDQPRAGVFERVLNRIGITSDLSRLVAATPELQGAALLTICVLAAGEAGVPTPLHGAGLVARRAIAVVGITFAILAVAALALPERGWTAAAWVLPALALTLATLALGRWLRVEVAAAAIEASDLGLRQRAPVLLSSTDPIGPQPVRWLEPSAASKHARSPSVRGLRSAWGSAC